MDAGRVSSVTLNEFTLANRRAKSLQLAIPRATAARFDRKNCRVVITLSSGLDVSFLPSDIQGLEEARPSQLEKMEISPSGFGIYFPELDADLYLPSLFQGSFGSRKWMQNKRSTSVKPAATEKKASAKAASKTPARRKRAARG
jgi:hypothetical protein